MGLQKCGGCLSCLLILLALWSIVINILLYFPDGKSWYASSDNLTSYVWYFEGICFSGILMLVLATLLIILDRDIFHECCQSESCTRTYRRFISVVLALLGIAFSGYSLIISTLSLVQGPYCRTSAGWEYAFRDTAGCYLMDQSSWSQCIEPTSVVEWNIILFSILMALNSLQMLICFLKVMAELKRILCGMYPVFVEVAEYTCIDLTVMEKDKEHFLKDNPEYYKTTGITQLFGLSILSGFFVTRKRKKKE